MFRSKKVSQSIKDLDTYMEHLHELNVHFRGFEEHI